MLLTIFYCDGIFGCYTPLPPPRRRLPPPALLGAGGSLLSLSGAGGSLPECGGVRVAPRPPSGCGGGPTLHSVPAPLPSPPSTPPPSRRSKGEEAVAGVGSSAAATYLPGFDERRVGSASFMRGCRIRCVEPRSGTTVDGYRRASSPSLTDGPGGGVRSGSSLPRVGCSGFLRVRAWEIPPPNS
jgi:hypothetical protein